MTRHMDNGVILYSGASGLGPEPIVFVVTGMRRKSENTGTGPMAQGWILLKNHHPSEAVSSGLDKSICGNCAFRKGTLGRGCYVTLMAPNAIWKAYRSGNYREGGVADIGSVPLRVGAYGDPAAVPLAFWRTLLGPAVQKWTGYTQEWRRKRMQALKTYFQASVKSQNEYLEAKNLGWSTFRTRLATDSVHSNEFICPKSEESTAHTTCYNCLLCNGLTTKKKDPCIIVHGNPAVRGAATLVTIRLGGTGAHHRAPASEEARLTKRHSR